jgi:hypothetical protein
MKKRALCTVIVWGASAFLGGCSTESAAPIDSRVAEEEQQPEGPFAGEIAIDSLGKPDESDPLAAQQPSNWTANQRDLSGLLPVETVLAGVTRDPIDGTIYLLDPNVGIYLLSEESAELVFAMGAITPEEHEPEGAFTDIAAMGFGRFALSAPNDGFILDLDEGTMWRHFCYLPPGNPSGDNLPADSSLSVALQEAGIEVWQRTDSLAYDASSGVLVAQPQTLAVQDNELFGAEIATFDELSGEPLSWTELPETTLRAGGLAVTGTQFLLGEGNVLHVYDRQSGWES